MKLSTNNRKRNWKIHTFSEIKQHTPEQALDQGGINKKSKTILRKMEIEAQYTNPCGIQQSNSKIKVYRYKCSYQNYRKISNKSLTLHFKELEKEKQNKAKLSRRGKNRV